MPMPREDTRSLRLLWHDGRVAVTTRRSFGGSTTWLNVSIRRPILLPPRRMKTAGC